MLKYFAYGSNLDDNRMISRGVNFKSKEKGILKGYRFIINKISQKNPNIGFANIIKDENSEVEGILYGVDMGDILTLDKWEGCPKHYRREVLTVNNEHVIVYIANDSWTNSNELYTTEEYKNHILEGKDFLSEKYFDQLLKIKTV
jgi:gamma-glutamylcyclotransferase (GGCT)/AIG2-like uncharacterized protein YtfP